jgi:FKBP-type peptidyl-prolyl cis-trans isomerase
MSRIRTVATILALSSLLAQANVTAARPMESGVLQQPQEQAMRCESPAQTKPLPALDIEVCDACNVSREEVSAMKRGYAVAAQVAGYRIDILATTRVRIIETGTLENGTPYAKGETAGMWFKVGNPDPGETLGSVAGRMTFVILSGIRQNTR